MNTGVDFQSMVLVAFWTVFLAELVGDKSLYALTSLALRYRLRVLYGAFAAASIGKMAIAVLLGSTLIRFQSRWTDVISAVAFFISAILIWMGDQDEGSKPELEHKGSPKGALAWCGIFFLTEWADPGQIAAAALALKSHLLWGTWGGGNRCHASERRDRIDPGTSAQGPFAAAGAVDSLSVVLRAGHSRIQERAFGLKSESRK